MPALSRKVESQTTRSDFQVERSIFVRLLPITKLERCCCCNAFPKTVKRFAESMPGKMMNWWWCSSSVKLLGIECVLIISILIWGPSTHFGYSTMKLDQPVQVFLRVSTSLYPTCAVWHQIVELPCPAGRHPPMIYARPIKPSGSQTHLKFRKLRPTTTASLIPFFSWTATERTREAVDRALHDYSTLKTGELTLLFGRSTTLASICQSKIRQRKAVSGVMWHPLLKGGGFIFPFLFGIAWNSESQFCPSPIVVWWKIL